MKDTQISSQLPHDCSSSGSTVSIFHQQSKSKSMNFVTMTKNLRIIGCLLLSLFCSLAAYGQTDAATIVGTVVDNSGAVLANEAVTIINVGTNAKTTVKTDSSGNYVATPLKIGTYSVAVEAQGFKGV